MYIEARGSGAGFIAARKAFASGARGKHHVPNVPDDLVVWRVTEAPIMNEPPGTCPGPAHPATAFVGCR